MSALAIAELLGAAVQARRVHVHGLRADRERLKRRHGVEEHAVQEIGHLPALEVGEDGDDLREDAEVHRFPAVEVVCLNSNFLQFQ